MSCVPFISPPVNVNKRYTLLEMFGWLDEIGELSLIHI